jgi:hypothetical protein
MNEYRKIMSKTKKRDAYGRKLDEMSRAVEKAIKASGSEQEIEVCYSAYEVANTGKEETDIPINNLHEVAVQGKVILVSDHDDFWGEGEPFRSVELDSPTWLEVCVQANLMIHCTGDHHHIFLEGLRPVKRKPGEYRFSMGS